MSSFSLKPNSIDQIIKGFKQANTDIDKALMKRMNAIVTVVYTTAKARRPKISKEQQKSLGRDIAGYRVSDPAASFGVPVKSGDLQASIKKDDIKLKNGKFIGRVYVDGPGAPYAEFLEFGTSKIQARSFMRAAMHVNREWIKREFEKRIQ